MSNTEYRKNPAASTVATPSAAGWVLFVPPTGGVIRRALISDLYTTVLDPRYVNVTGDTMTGALSVTTADTSGITVTNTGTSGAAVGGGFLYLVEDDGAAMASGDRIGGVLFRARRSASLLSNAAGVFAYADEAWFGTGSGSRLSFEVTPNGSTTRSVAMTILNSGNVGIGTTSPLARFHMDDSGGWDSVLMGRGNLGGVVGPYIGFNAHHTAVAGTWDTAHASWDGAVIIFQPHNVDTSSIMQFGFVDQATVATNVAMTIRKDGLVGIGIASSIAARLHTVGSAPATPVAIVQGAASQSANLLEARNSSSTVLASISAAGYLKTPRYEENATGIGFFGATPVAKPTLSAAATDLATALTLVNDLRTRLINYGLAA